MFYETARTVGPGWQRSYRPSHYEDMSWSPQGGGGTFRSPGSSPESYRRRVDDFPRGRDEEFFGRRSSPTFPRRIFKEGWTDSPNHRTFTDRPRMFKRVFRPSEWTEEFDDEPHLRRVEREMDDRDFERRFQHHRDHLPDFEQAGGRVHHIPIVVEQRRGSDDAPRQQVDEEEEEERPPQVHRLRKAFEGGEDPFSPRRGGMFSRREPVWDPAAARTLPTRKGHKASQSFDDSRHPVHHPVHRSRSETHEEPQTAPSTPHSAAFRSHSDGHCPHQTYTPAKEVTPEEAPQEGASSSLGLQQIQAVLQTAEDLRRTVEAYSGSGRDKQYRFLDEMLTRCMLRLDDVDTEGREDVRAARKGAVREVQACIDRLEEKADEGYARQNPPPKVIPLEEPVESPPKVIPLEGPPPLPKVIPLEGAQQPPKVIPLGDVPGREPPKDTENKKDGEEKGEPQKDDGEVQTKL